MVTTSRFGAALQNPAYRSTGVNLFMELTQFRLRGAASLTAG
jgi:hypothetical protein